MFATNSYAAPELLHRHVASLATVPSVLAQAMLGEQTGLPSFGCKWQNLPVAVVHVSLEPHKQSSVAITVPSVFVQAIEGEQMLVLWQYCPDVLVQTLRVPQRHVLVLSIRPLAFVHASMF